jgi:hypothetical protein
MPCLRLGGALRQMTNVECGLTLSSVNRHLSTTINFPLSTLSQLVAHNLEK